MESPPTRMPLVSVIITNRNYEKYVGQAIQSVADQSYPNIECVIVDDCSFDGSFDPICDFLAKLDDTRFRCIRLGENLGQMAAIKAGMENTQGEFVASLDADDLWMPEFVNAHLAAHLNQSFSASISASDTIQIDENGAVLEGTYHMLVKHRTNVPGGLHKPVLLASVPTVGADSIMMHDDPNASPIVHIDRSHSGWHYCAMSSMMFRRAALDLIMPKDTSATRLCADYYLASFCHLLTGSLTIGRPLSYFRLHGSNHFSRNRVLGGPHSPGVFASANQNALDGAILNHLIDNVDLWAPILSLEFCANTILNRLGRKRLYKAVKRSPTLRMYFGRGSDRTFRLKYGILYRYLRKR